MERWGLILVQGCKVKGQVKGVDMDKGQGKRQGQVDPQFVVALCLPATTLDTVTTLVAPCRYGFLLLLLLLLLLLVVVVVLVLLLVVQLHPPTHAPLFAAATTTTVAAVAAVAKATTITAVVTVAVAVAAILG